MDDIMIALRWIHIAAGMIALFVAPGAMVTVKGGRAHRRWGKVYFWSMATVAVTALALAVWRPNYFLLMVAVFSFYLALSAYRALFRKRPSGAGALDWTSTLATLVASVGLVILGLVQPSPVWQRLGVVAIVFGAIGAVVAGRHAWHFVRPSTDRQAWWFDHMIGMLASYIATVTAFSVVNFTFLPPVVRWLWPTLVGTPLIAAWVSYYKGRFRRRSAATPAVS
ncbi:MAG: hypothetical protein AUH30_02605 [Candidatus Rokubacteria bacterium 13_1_40CM_68_15]|nr:MAG: hypothetical protein AUH30_02605 [Candidatus Rokubacteria bacterium 13_1_40CM_68_15]